MQVSGVSSWGGGGYAMMRLAVEGHDSVGLWFGHLVDGGWEEGSSWMEISFSA